MINIGFLIMNFSNGGGTERVTSIIASEFAKNNYNVSIISCNNGLEPKYQYNSKIKLFSLHGEEISNSVLRKISNYNKLRQIVKSNNIDVMIAVDVALYLYLYPLQRDKMCKCIAWEHFNYYTRQNIFSKISRKLAIKYANKIIVLGKKDKMNYINNNPKISNIDYIYNPISINCDESPKLENKRIIAVGRLEEQKGFDYLIEIWNKVENKFPDWKLDIFGEGSQKKILLEMIKDFKLKNISINNFTTNIKKEFLNSTIFLLSSRYEGFGLVLLEAQACGLPCISFDCKEGPSEIIDDGVNGYLVRCYDTDEFAKKISILMENEKIIHRFSKNSKKDLKRFKIENIFPKWEKTVKTILSSKE